MYKGLNNKQIYRDYVKRPLDFILGSVALIILSPFIGIIALLVRIKLGSPVIFKQARPGKNEKIFYLYKFRSMTNAVDENGILLSDRERLTSFGKFLRKTSLDELPELVNIVKGDMGIVGPRPLSIYYLPHYSVESRKRHKVRPGLTGLAQINGRNNLEWNARFSLDVKYVEQISFLQDAKIVLSTVLKVIKATDVVMRGSNKIIDFGPYSIIREEGASGMKRVGMTYSEIGSYFWLNDEVQIRNNIPYMGKESVSWLPLTKDSTFTFSGRAAIELAIKDIILVKKVKIVYVPSYCCVSMLQAFIDHGISIKFYEVLYKDGMFTYDIPLKENFDVILIMRYFGFDSENYEKIMERLHDKKVIIIEDITHSLFNGCPVSVYSDYLVASLRKWFAIPSGGWLGKQKVNLEIKPYMNSDGAVVEKIHGMKEKKAYITGKSSNKENFLMLQSQFENELIHADCMLEMDKLSYNILQNIDIEEMKIRRKKNVKVLMKELSKLQWEFLEVPEYDVENNTPLFLPVFLRTKERESLRQYLIQMGIYCPVHWPEVMGTSIGVREKELSLICDQRYTETDMKAIVECMQEWYHLEKLK